MANAVAIASHVLLNLFAGIFNIIRGATDIGEVIRGVECQTKWFHLWFLPIEKYIITHPCAYGNGIF